MKITSNQTGFSAVEAILIIVVLGIIGFTGWFVYHSKQATDKTLSQTNIGTNTQSTPHVQAKTKLSTYTVSDLGIEIQNVPSTLNDLTNYTYASDTNKDANNTLKTPVKSVAVQFSTQSLTNADPSCSAKDGGSIGALARTNGTYVNNETEDNTLFVKQFNGFYITYSHPEAACSNSDSAETIHSSQTSLFQALVTKPANLVAH